MPLTLEQLKLGTKFTKYLIIHKNRKSNRNKYISLSFYKYYTIVISETHYTLYHFGI